MESPAEPATLGAVRRDVNIPSSLRTTAGAVLVALVSVACAARNATVPIRSLLDNPSEYDGKTVAASGKVTEAAGALGLGTYRINDGTGSLMVVSSQGGAPRQGAQVDVEGIFRAVFTVGTRSGAVLEERKRKNSDQ